MYQYLAYKIKYNDYEEKGLELLKNYILYTNKFYWLVQINVSPFIFW